MKRFLFFLLFIFSNIATSSAIDYVSKSGEEKRDNVINLINSLRSWRNFSSEAQDYSGYTAKFNIMVLTQRERWKLGNTQILESGKLARYVLPYYLSYQLNILKKAREIICVGTASYEGSIEIEQARAKARANLLKSIATRFLKSRYLTNKTLTLNLGKFNINENSRNTSYQRRIIIIAIDKDSDPEVKLREALKNGISNNTLLNINISDYSHFIIE